MALKMQKIQKSLSILFLFALTACSQFNNNKIATESDTTTNSISWEEHQQKIQQLNTWSLRGKLAILINDKRQSANIYWQQENENYTIQLTSFIGIHVLTVKKTDQKVEIINDNDEVFTGENAESLIQEIAPQLSLPISALQQWIKGNPVNASYELNQQQQVNRLLGEDPKEGLWVINFQQYQRFSGYALPRQLDLKRDDIRLKIAINQWQVTKE
jgi:outer membrane lipoprotein LolB